MRIAKASPDMDSFDDPIIVKTPEDFDEGMRVLSQSVQELSNGESIEYVSGSIAGVIMGDSRTLVRSSHLLGWEGKELNTKIKEALSCIDVFIQNDGELVGLGEAHYGAGKGYPIVAYITISTGVGGGRIVDGFLDRKSVGMEPGHQIIDFDKTLCKDCSDVGIFEDFVSGSGVEARFGKEAYEIPQNDLLWEDLALWSAIGLKNTIVHWSPDVLVLGGSMITGNPAIPLNRIEENLKKLPSIFPTLPVIKKAELDSVGGLYGTLVYLKQKKSTLS